MTWNEIVREILLVSNLAPMGQDADPDLNERTQRVLVRMLSAWSRDGFLSPFTSDLETTLISGQNLYTAGPGGDFTARPVQIFQAILSGSTLGLVRLPVEIMGWDDFQALSFPSAPGLPKQISINLKFPQLQIGVYPTPNSNWTLRLVAQLPWEEIDFDEEAVLPPGYESAIISNGGVWACKALNRDVSMDLKNQARDEKSGIVLNSPQNDKSQGNMFAQRYRSTRVRNWLADTPL